MADRKPYRGFSGFVQFDPKEDTVNGKKIRRVTIRVDGPKDNKVQLTLWPSHKAIQVEKGDYVSAEGQYTTREVDGENGTRTYHNLSVTNLLVLNADSGARDQVDNARGDDNDDEDDPW